MLATVSISVFDRYYEWLCGPEVWGLCSQNSAGQAVSTPTIDHVLALDLAIRKKVAESMNEGLDFKAALEKAKANDGMFQVDFLSCVAIDVSTPACRAVTAPGVAPPASGKKRGAQLALTDSHTPPPPAAHATTRPNKKARKAAAKAKAAAAAAKPGNPHKNPKGNPKGGPKGDGKGKGPGIPDGAVTTDPKGGGEICFNYNRSRACAALCPRFHVCWFCGKGHPGGETRANC